MTQQEKRQVPIVDKFQKPRNTKQTLKRLLNYLLAFRAKLALVIVLVLISSISTVAASYLLKPLINDYIGPLTGTNPSGDDYLPLIRFLMVMAGIYLSSILASYLYNYQMMKITNSVLNNLRRDLFNKIQDLPIKYFDTHTHGEIMSRFTNDVETFRQAISNGFVQFISSTVSVLGIFILMIVLSPILTLIIVLTLVVMFLIIKKIGSNSAKFFKKQQKELGEVNGFVEEMIEGQKVVKVFCYEENIVEDFNKKNENLRIAATDANTYANIIMPIMGNLGHLNYAATAAVGAILCINGMLDIGSLASFLQFTRQFSQPITQISQQINAILAAFAGAERIFEVLDQPKEFDEGYVTLVNVCKEGNEMTECSNQTGHWAWKHVNSDNQVEYIELKGDVRFNNVTFAYNEGTDVLKNVSLYAKPGQKIAFVGSTGAGKTTITNLINRFYEIQQGEITYDGIDIKKIKKEDLRRSLAMVLQDTHLFTGTIRENIRYGRLDATDEEVEEAAKLANADSFIKYLPDGYDTLLTSDGANLSQGQRQLLSIARAAVANPPVLILDEATSSIDTRTEALIEKGMDKLMEGRTVFVIAHRLSTVRNSNAIMVLENGQIIERGDHENLLKQEGRYFKLYTGQFELN
ncbi:MAG: putative ABC transporter ATP-binding protein [Firmicutes bacterium ADurb.Bin146]|nr:MAG: putative ABC transporter ATP-binding protein [Firmicutes bacterium ADurb.Bin146]